ncbi:MAG: hypothetical protein DHS20C11_25540 [Lysobacteraceae bacterium]|nr:MAG: hypothetical protein DHS20C11_25540 [Xanthomonadaceae bacterium]
MPPAATDMATADTAAQNANPFRHLSDAVPHRVGSFLKKSLAKVSRRDSGVPQGTPQAANDRTWMCGL